MERHDILYSRARAVLNHNVKRLWFRINPFLERKSTLKGKPEHENKFVQPLRSAVLCENYIIGEGDQRARDSRNIPIVKFWDFLYSDEWSNGCALRVLEGELMDDLMFCLYLCEREKFTTSHKTFAFARNTRERRGCYKLANQKGCGQIQETLLLEFTYYGRRIPRPVSPGHLSWSSYPDSTTASSALPFMRSSATESDDDEKRESEHLTKSGSFLPRINERASSVGFYEESRPTKQTTTDSALSQSIEIIPKTPRVEKYPSSSSSSGRGYPVEANLHTFPCSERVCSSNEGNEMLFETTDELTLDECEFEEELYLSDLQHVRNEKESTLSKLRRNKEALIKSRKEENLQQRRTEFYRRKRQLPSMPDFDIDKVEISNTAMSTFQFAFLITKVPSFEEFLNIIDTENQYDPRYKKSKQVSKKIAKRYNLTKDALRKRNLEMIDINTDVQKRFNLLRKLPMFARKSGVSVATDDSSKSEKSGSPTKSQSYGGMKRVKPYTERFAAEVGGVTDSKECENHVLKQNLKIMAGTKEKCASPKKKQLKTPDLLVTSPSGQVTNFIGGKASPSHRSKIKSSPTKTRSLAKKDSEQVKKMSDAKTKFPSRISSETSSSSDSDESDFEDTVFDSTKLNRKYSVEKVKGKNYRKRKPAFYEILKKYYRAQRAVDLFTRSSPDKKDQRKSIFQRLMEKKPPKAEYVMEIGKMKKFSFLNARTSTKDTNIEQPDFSNPKPADFLERMKQALDDFVVRREHVVSDYRGKTSTTLTFTRKGVFHKHFHP